jgi:hypothetical protein
MRRSSLHQHQVTPAKAGTAVFFTTTANRGSRFRGNDAVGGIAVCGNFK